mgnify:CR=1 FL=1
MLICHQEIEEIILKNLFPDDKLAENRTKKDVNSLKINIFLLNFAASLFLCSLSEHKNSDAKGIYACCCFF